MFRNARMYRLGAPFDHGATELEAALETHRFRPCGPVEVATLGWSAPLGEDTAALVHGVGGCLLLCMRKQERLRPSAAVAETVDERIMEIETGESRDVGRAERRALREQVINEMLPRAFTRSRRTLHYVDTEARGTVERFRWVRAPTTAELTELTHTRARRVGGFLQRQGLLACDGGQSFLAEEVVAEGSMAPLLAHSITYRIAVGPQAGRKVFTLQTLPASEEPFDDPVGQVAGFSLHAGVAAKAQQRQKLERLCRYISRPAVSEKRLSLTPNGNVRYRLKTPPD